MRPEDSSIGPRAPLPLVMATGGGASAIMAVHAAYGARRYDEPGLYHVIALSVAWLLLTMFVSGAYGWRPRAVTRWALVVLVGLPYVGNFGLLHGAVGHGLKLLAFACGTSPERLAELFDFFLAGIAVAYALVRFVRASRGS